MIQTLEIQSGNYYLIESLSSGGSCYYESEEEISYFKRIFKRYIEPYCKIHKMYLSSEGYRVLLQVRGEGVLRRLYKMRCDKKGKDYDDRFLEESWRILSEQFRIFHSVYVKGVNNLRGRKGVLVQDRYRRYYFEDRDSYEEYVKKMDEGEEVVGQKKERYRVDEQFRKGVNWGVIRGMDWVEGLMDKWFQSFVVEYLVKLTFSKHKPPN